MGFSAKKFSLLHKPKDGISMPIMNASPILDFVVSRLEARDFTYQQVAEGSGVPKRTVEKIARRETQNPGVRHVERLAAFFREPLRLESKE
jgi:transcriptional regulator with XRE-family HTH domain